MLMGSSGVALICGETKGRRESTPDHTHRSRHRRGGCSWLYQEGLSSRISGQGFPGEDFAQLHRTNLL